MSCPSVFWAVTKWIASHPEWWPPTIPPIYKSRSSSADVGGARSTVTSRIARWLHFAVIASKICFLKKNQQIGEKFSRILVVEFHWNSAIKMQLEENFKLLKLNYPPLDDSYIQSTSAPSKLNRSTKIDHTQTLRKLKKINSPKKPTKIKQKTKKKVARKKKSTRKTRVLIQCDGL